MANDDGETRATEKLAAARKKNKNNKICVLNYKSCLDHVTVRAADAKVMPDLMYSGIHDDNNNINNSGTPFFIYL